MKKIKQRMFGVMLALALMFAGTDFFGFYGEVKAEAASGREMAVHFLDVGQGLSILVQSGGENLLYDGGDRSASGFVVSYLQNQQITNIDYIIASHYDEDHLSGLIGCLNAFSVSNVIGPDYVHDSKLYQSFINAADAQGLEVQHPQVGTVYDFGTGGFTVLSPQSTDAGNSNANSVAVRLTNGENSFIFTGDAEYRSEAEMIASGLDLDCDVLSVGHHGSASSTSWDFLEATIPEYAVISCGTDNQYGHPDADTMEKLAAMEISVFRNDKQGTMIAVSDGNDIEWNMEPCNDYSAGDEKDTGTQAGGDDALSEETAEEQLQTDAGAEDSMQAAKPQESGAWLSATGSKYHSIPDCGNMNPDKAIPISREDAEAQGYEACKKCW